MKTLYRCWTENRKSQTWLILSAPNALTARKLFVEYWAGATEGRTVPQITHVIVERC